MSMGLTGSQIVAFIGLLHTGALGPNGIALPVGSTAQLLGSAPG